MSSVFIEIADGYTEPFLINEVEGLHGKLSGKFRPMLPDERDTMYQKAMEKKKRVEQNTIYRRCLKNHLVEWDAVDSNGQPVAISEHVLRHLRPALWDKLVGVITCDRASDLPKEAEVDQEGDEDDDLARSMQEAAEGQAPTSKLEADAKN